MGVVNVTPDSFSDGGKFFDHAVAIDHALALSAAGADLLDVGGESTRPYARSISAAEELRRVIPVVASLAQRTNVPISIDTSKAAIALEALAAGAEIVNDVTALAGDPRMIEIARTQAAGICAMHMRGSPQTMQVDPRYADVVGEVVGYLRARCDALVAAGIDVERIALDPGIGFGKTHQHNLTLLANAHHFHELRCPLVVGPSRKGFIGKVLGDKTADRTAGTIGVALSLAAQGVQVIRVHDIAPVREALLLFEATGGIDGRAAEL
jgi:dihydropteroate synthase